MLLYTFHISYKCYQRTRHLGIYKKIYFTKLSPKNPKAQIVGLLNSCQLTTMVVSKETYRYTNQKYVYAATPRPRERFENANICIFPTFQETVGSHLNPIETFFVVSVNSSPLAKISEYISIHIYIMQPQLHADEFYIGRGLINLCRWSMGKLNKFNQKIVLKNLTVVTR